MLIEFKVANFRSIHEEQTLSMVASNYSNELPENLLAVDAHGVRRGTRLVKAVVLYGANASGKSNVVGALRFLAEFVRDSATKLQPGAKTGVQTFWLDPSSRDKPSRFEISAIINGIRTLYGLELDASKVVKEFLVAYPSIKAQVWFERKWDSKSSTYKWSAPTPHFAYDNGLREAVRPNSSFVSVLAQFNQPQALQVWQCFASNFRFLNLAEQYPAPVVALEWLRTDEGVQRMNQIMSFADVGVCEVKAIRLVENAMERLKKKDDHWISKPEPEGIKLLMQALEEPLEAHEEVEPVFTHVGPNGVSTWLDFESGESAGTKRFFALAGIWLRALQTGGVLVLDEIETSLHPLLLTALIRTFLSAENTGSAQLVFTTHNPLLLDQTLLRRDQIWFTEKDRGGATRLYPLTDYQPRKDESLLRGYLAGRYGGVPFVPEGLKF